MQSWRIAPFAHGVRSTQKVSIDGFNAVRIPLNGTSSISVEHRRLQYVVHGSHKVHAAYAGGGWRRGKLLQ